MLLQRTYSPISRLLEKASFHPKSLNFNRFISAGFSQRNSAFAASFFSTSGKPNQISNAKEAPVKDADFRGESMLKAEKQRNRFWKIASVKASTDGYEICLDGRVLKTPGGTPLKIPSDRTTFAHLVAGEWESQEKVLKTHALPLTSLAARAMDGLSTKESRQELVATLAKYLDTDSVCYHQEYPESLVKLQNQHFDPLLSWVEEKYGVKPLTTCSIIGKRQPEEIRQVLQKAALQLDPLELAGLALMNRQISVETAAQASHVEVQFQISQWGEVEDTHDVDNQSIRRNLGAAVATTIRD